MWNKKVIMVIIWLNRSKEVFAVKCVTSYFLQALRGMLLRVVDFIVSAQGLFIEITKVMRPRNLSQADHFL